MTAARAARMCPSVCLFLGILLSLRQPKASVRLCDFVFVQTFIFVCVQRSGLTSVCVSMHESWARIPSVDKKNVINEEIRGKCVPNWNMWCQGSGRG